MKRTKHGCGIIGLLLAFGVSVSGLERPNIILIMADDMGYECVTANGGESYRTPNLDRLAASGMRFEHCYSQPLCTPSRVQLMTGIYNSRNYIRFGLLDPQAYTFAHLLKQAGYATGIAGKWQLEGGLQAPYQFGFDEYCLWQVNRRPNRYPNPGLEINGKQVDYAHGEYGPDVVNKFACEFIERNKERPFFLYYPMILPHFPFEPTPDSPDWDPIARRGDKVESRGIGDKRYFADMVAYTDKLVGKLVAKVDQLGLRGNTIILFTGDNGSYAGIISRFQGRDWRAGKGYMMDNGTRVPLIVSWPGTVPSERVNRDLIDFTDFFPTLAEITGAKVPDHLKLDGHSFAAQLRGERGHPREWIYCWYYRNGKPTTVKEKTAGEWARTHRYKLYHDGQFFDLSNDFYETNPLDASSLTPEEQQVRNRLQAVIDQYTRSARH